MSVDEPVRLRLHRRLSELLDAELADAMMESMPPTRWDQLATKDDLQRLDARTERIERTLVDHGERFEHLDARTERLESLMAAQGERLENRIDALGERLDARLHSFSGEMALLEGRLSVRYAETTRMIVFAMMTLFVGVVAVMATTLA
ncbi:MAG: hypothetical protein R8F63_00585 [Acidimicrobiales bacterium]|nr:hypothetical protein [Acidimicrobiales bacterium]